MFSFQPKSVVCLGLVVLMLASQPALIVHCATWKGPSTISEAYLAAGCSCGRCDNDFVAIEPTADAQDIHENNGHSQEPHEPGCPCSGDCAFCGIAKTFCHAVVLPLHCPAWNRGERIVEDALLFPSSPGWEPFQPPRNS